jgi:hypothetical protein
MNYILAVLLIIFPSLCYCQIGQIDCSKAIDDIICSSFPIQSCSLPTTQKICPNKCFCSGIDIQLPPTNIARPSDEDTICSAFELSSCQYKSIKDMCPNRCSSYFSTEPKTQLPTVQDDEICAYFTLSNCIIVATQISCPNLCSGVIVSTSKSTSASTINTKTTTQLPTVQDDEICAYFTLSNCIIVATQISCPNLCSAVIVSTSTSTSTSTTTTESTSASTLNTKTTQASTINCDTAQDDSICSGFTPVGNNLT